MFYLEKSEFVENNRATLILKFYIFNFLVYHSKSTTSNGSIVKALTTNTAIKVKGFNKKTDNE